MKTARGFLKPCFAVAGIAAVVAAVVGGITSGGTGAWAAPAGVALAALGFAGSVWAVAWAEKIDLRLTLPMALITYAVKLGIAFAALAAVRALLPDALTPFAFGIIGGAVAWLAAQVVWAYKAKIPYIELERRP
ncbi:hypothetical protein K3N28_18130 [Glycomyces sp. TRM65418]|uniref:hypothetical protein n=1 Tax=Glycomyces sp. TRM65418 TaxID=2867006 RepID=UPI001CE575E7|nr:hypothetical protein [Glycomyces sp. TRM65418]MCC3764981.1 hypothetical protein [Glycomyces sp. TRM65418]QZD54617.1 hypothetical protein K3N28_18040 [Glycomyces sp. TRM65418]